jgi:PmbA protein
VAEVRADEAASLALKAAKEAGADQAEAFVVSSHTLSAYIDDSRVKSVEDKVDLGLSMRVLRNGRVGQSSSYFASPKQVETCAKAAVIVSALLPKDTVFKHFPAPVRSTIKVKTLDPAVADLTPEAMADLAKAIVASGAEAKRVKVPNGVLRAAIIESRLMNSNQVDVSRKASMVYVHVTSMTEGARPGEGEVSFFSPELRTLDATALGEELKRKAKAASQAVAYKGKANLSAVIAPHDLAEMFRGSISFALSAENVNRQRSPWAKSLNKPVASPSVELADDPSDPRGMLSSPYDDEGVPAKKKDLVRGGLLKGFLNDTYNASFSQKPPTGNGLRRSSLEPAGNYLLPVSVGPMCMVLQPGPRSVEQLVAELDEGIVVEKISAPDVHPITGAFGLEVRCGHLVKKGEITGAVKHCLLVGNLFQALGKVVAVANDSTVSANHILPSVCFGELELAGSE